MEQMIIREGKSVYKGVAIGRIFVCKKAEKNINEKIIELKKTLETLLFQGF